MADQSTNVSRSSNTPVLVAVVAVALAGLVGLNVMANKAAPKSEHELEAEQKEASASTSTPVASASPAAAAPVATGDPNSLVMLGQGEAAGAGGAGPEVVVGFSWTPTVQSDPSKVSIAVNALQNALGNQAKVKVVNVDDQPNVPEGVSVGGRVVVAADQNGAISPGAVGAVKQALLSAPPGPK